MNIIYNSKASKEADIVLKSLQSAVTHVLEKKERLGQYAVMWDGKKTIKTMKPMSS